MLRSRGARPTRARTNARPLGVCLLALPMLALPLAAARPAVAASAPASHLPPRLEVHADSVGFYPYSDATLLSAEGHARVRAGNRRITADSIRVDLKTNKLIASGNVIVAGRENTLYVTAYSLDLNTGKAEAIRLDPTPRTIALVDDNLSSAKEGPAPSDTFGVADLTGQRPYIHSTNAIVTTNANIRMTPAEFPTSSGARGVLPTFVYTYQYNQLFANQSLPSTTIDYPYTLFGTPNSLTALHARYSQYDGIELGLDEKLVDGNREYVIASILPFRGKRIDLNANQAIRRGLIQNFTGTLQKGLTSGDYSLSQNSQEYSIKANAYAENAYNNETLTLSSVNGYVHHVVRYQTTFGYGYEHNPRQYPFDGDFSTLLTAQVNPVTIPLPHGLTLSSQYNYSIQKYDIPHIIVHNTSLVSLATPNLNLVKNGSRSVSFIGSVQFDNVANRYRDDAAAHLGLPNPAYPYHDPDGTNDPGYFAYDGVATQRTYMLQTYVQAPHDFSFRLNLAYNHDFIQGHGLGRAPLVAYGDMAFRLTSAFKVDVSRSYSFGIEGQRYSQYNFYLSP